LASFFAASACRRVLDLRTLVFLSQSRVCCEPSLEDCPISTLHQ
jgi:hypothetical protein